MSTATLTESAFEELSHRHRRELHVHCYRMLASYDEAEDAVQEAFLRAWRGRADFDGGALVRAWLYRIATNVCLDVLRAKGRRAIDSHACNEISWLQPYPDRQLDQIPSSEDGPDVVAVARETIELAYLAALQTLPPRQRAALILREVLGLPAAEIATHLDTSVAAVNSALQRARITMQDHLPSHRSEWSATSSTPSADERELVAKFIDAHQRYDTAAAIALIADDIRITMPPYDMCFDGVQGMLPLLERAFGPDRDGEWRLVPTTANRMPAAGSYLLRPGDSEYRAFKLDVIRVEEGKVAEITTFGPALFPEFGLPSILD